ncbi:hypothetical protein AMTR_s00028p00150640 [Amborella trichopoda]|uniref:Uncharacterized protein n=1 Tax=Amborella trichopoda TaxID=13333 RepID=W1PKR4_AMBTC|nr:hypothetical protein AMTR_s00028p00150640 [Amborella trichopoda]
MGAAEWLRWDSDVAKKRTEEVEREAEMGGGDGQRMDGKVRQLELSPGSDAEEKKKGAREGQTAGSWF